MKTFFLILFSFAHYFIMAQDTTITRVEYFVDTDPGIGAATAINVMPSDSDVLFSFPVNISVYTPGFHKLYIRTRDEPGRWSITARRNFEVYAPDIKNKIISGEYFIDQENDGFGTGFPINIDTPDSIVLQNFNVATTGLTEGYHKLYGRFKDSLGDWSHTFRRNLEVIKETDKNVINGEYFFRVDNEFGNCNSFSFSPASPDASYSFIIPFPGIPSGADTLFLRVRDSADFKWSITQWADSLFLVVVPLKLLDFTAIKKENHTVQLNWQTESEINTSYFNIQRSTDAIHYSNVGRKPAAGNNTHQNYYTAFDDIRGITADKIYYRLEMVDADGKDSYSKIAVVVTDAVNNPVILSPNPAHNYFYINGLEGKANISIRDVSGKIIKKVMINSSAGKVDISGISQGAYFISIEVNNKVFNRKLLIE